MVSPKISDKRCGPPLVTLLGGNLSSLRCHLKGKKKSAGRFFFFLDNIAPDYQESSFTPAL